MVLKDGNYLLLRKDTVIARFGLNPSRMKSNPLRQVEVIEQNKAPFAVRFSDGTKESLWQWMKKRVIPGNRHGLEKAELMVGNIIEAALSSGMLSLMDQYWIKQEEDERQWKDVCFIHNGYSYDIGNILFGNITENPALNSPDLTTGGIMPKCWRRMKDGDYLIKSGSMPYFQEPYNEVFASNLAKKLYKGTSVEYKLANIGGRPASICRNFLDENTMLVTASEVCMVFPREYNIDLFRHFETCAKAIGIKDFKKPIASMLLFDYIIGNRDRHLGNFGFLYDTEKDEWKGFAPLFDNGSCLWSDCRTELINDNTSDKAMPFGENFADQLSHLKNRDYVDVDLDELEASKDLIRKSFSKYNSRRAEYIVKKYGERVDMACKMISEKQAYQKHEDIDHKKNHRKDMEVEI